MTSSVPAVIARQDQDMKRRATQREKLAQEKLEEELASEVTSIHQANMNHKHMRSAEEIL